MRKLINGLFLTLITLITFSCSDVPSPYDVNDGGNGGGNTELTGDGTKENPYDIASAMKKQDGSEAWVMGYIVGAVNDKAIATDAAFEAPFKLNSNILIAASKDEKDYKKCLAVQLYDDVRNAVNLVDHADNLGKAIVISGKLVKYYGVAGLKECKTAVFDGKEIGGGGSTGPVEGDNPFNLDASKPVNAFFANFDDAANNADYAFAGWTNAFKQGDRKWQGAIFQTDKYIKATAQKGTEGATFETWFISPAITVNNVADKKVLFDCSGAYYVANSSLKVFFLELVNGKMTSTEISVANVPTSGTNYTWTRDLTVDLTAFAGKVGFVGFQYIGIGGSGTSTTYCLDNIRTSGATAGDNTGGNTGGETGGKTENSLLKFKDIEAWTSAFPALFESATNDPNLTADETNKHAGSFSLKHMSPVGKGNSAIKQEIAVTPGKKYKVSFWYFDNEPNAKGRIWCSWINTLGNKITFAKEMTAEKAELAKLQPNTFSEDAAEWKQFSVEVVAPLSDREVYNSAKLLLEIRTYPENKLSGAVYYDDIEVTEVQ